MLFIEISSTYRKVALLPNYTFNNFEVSSKVTTLCSSRRRLNLASVVQKGSLVLSGIDSNYKLSIDLVY